MVEWAADPDAAQRVSQPRIVDRDAGESSRGGAARAVGRAGAQLRQPGVAGHPLNRGSGAGR